MFEHKFDRCFTNVRIFLLKTMLDVTTPYTSAIDTGTVISKLQSTSDMLFTWFKNNHMKANPEKCHLLIRIHWRLSEILKTSNKSVWSNVFWYVKVYIFQKCIQYTIHWDKTQMLKKFSLDKINGRESALVLLSGGPTHYSFNISWSTRFVSLKLIFNFRFRFVLKFMCLFNKMTLKLTLALKRQNSFQN